MTKTKYATIENSRARPNGTSGNGLVKPAKLRRSQQKAAEEVCQIYNMKLRSGLTIEKKACYFRRGITKKPDGKFQVEALRGPSFTEAGRTEEYLEHTGTQAALSSFLEYPASLSTYNDKSVTFTLVDKSYVINVGDKGKKQKKDKVLLRYYESPYSSSESGDGVDGKMLMVNMSPTNDAHLLLHANKKKHSVEFHRYENRLSDLAFFVVHKESSECVSFECKSHRGTYLGVKDNHLGLIQGKNPGSENILFKLS
ncbi:interleukin-33 isoform X1 [Oryctolagus cuniculus]|uniref:interleukin-33 isoform X1 n=2 Tax=Oryctolagus cuniculus TaxID=9986 RepID=UPI00222EB290|nr:interleukin-33 isoform X1 [Oryctolagus cuniculus]XP_008253216.2 interleukin-33 isoform X1 [Oryctolagus cuniculus]XP_008253222.2 interleukin-33 isoform X1 [Oryctolagus cuniculus]XP_008253228.2 interleukin-33 isoform X1 [Oryctolagus cuniculus]XP_008253234.2 interleukin-33 isoform X1 [Oryctolagus cuniculus]XP_051701821.1 interleukin-33 isoform X1 [Oryctolagus cuniculus]